MVTVRRNCTGAVQADCTKKDNREHLDNQAAAALHKWICTCLQQEDLVHRHFLLGLADGTGSVLSPVDVFSSQDGDTRPSNGYSFPWTMFTASLPSGSRIDMLCSRALLSFSP
jgi:hypothetical protein